MSKRHAGWISHRIKSFVNNIMPESSNDSLTIRSYKAVSGLEKKFIYMLLNLNQYSRGISYRSGFSNPLFKKYPNFFIDPILPSTYNMFFLKNIYISRLLAIRSSRAKLMVKGRPAHGQRRWSNAKMAKKCSGYITQMAKSFETDLFNLEQDRKFQWSKSWEMRQKAKMRRKTNKKQRWNKFKKFGEKRLALKRKKKTPWD